MAASAQNVIPSEGEAMLDVRALPDEDMAKFAAELRRVINDDAVEVIPATEGRPAAPPSRIDTEMFRAIEKVGRSMFQAPTIPSMMTGATDMAQLRAKGVQAYGVGEPVVVRRRPPGRRALRQRAHLRSLPDDPDPVPLEYRVGSRIGAAGPLSYFHSLTSTVIRALALRRRP